MVKQMLKLKNFRWFFLSEIFYCFAIGMGTVGANWVLVDTTGSAQLIGLLLTVNVLAGFFASLRDNLHLIFKCNFAYEDSYEHI